MQQPVGFLPIADERAKILILGSMPGQASLARQQYYAHPRNAFWRIASELLGFDPDCGYDEKKRILLASGVAVWDVIMSCRRPGSLDSRIFDRSIVVNDFPVFLRDHADIRHIFFNGSRAQQEYGKRVMPLLSGRARQIPCTRLPSTSPAMANLSFEQKLDMWSVIKQWLIY